MNAQEFLKGKKVYIAAILRFLLALETFIETGNVQILLEGVWQAFLIAAARAALTNENEKI